MQLITKILLRLYTPAALVAVSGVVVAEGLDRAADGMGMVSAAHLASLSLLLAILISLALASYSTWRLWRWLKGIEQRCDCGGLLSRPRTDHNGQRYRTCVVCGGRAEIG
ncbi:hypothetical protein [Pseudoxanthomonas dokdonensis]|uniref:hypothetical protein n=1 Tax=Pseudoxanthomonas dokdonensis TaxID=344882 RepID=UPI000ABAAFB9|nr:hypothetical protein [Pseudoxanthomonas dokdonensis]